MDDTGARGATRRRLLTGLAGAGTALVAGCSSGSGGSEATPTPDADAAGGEPTPYPERLSPPVAGNPDADVTLAVYEDYACPHCADYNREGFPQLEDAYVSTGEIRYEHRDLPIPVTDPGSWQAANAARAVQHRSGDDAFWQYAKALFERSSAIPSEAPGLFGTLADEQGHDGTAVQAAAVNRVYRRSVRGDRQRAVDLGAEATPTFVLNGEIVTSGFGSGTVETVGNAIESALSETG